MSQSGSSSARLLLTDYRSQAGRRLPVALSLMLAGALAEGFGILALLPVLALAAGEAAIPDRLAGLTATWAGLGEDGRLAAALLLFVGVMVARSLLLFARDRYLARLTAEYEASLKLRSAATLAARGWRAAAKLGQAGMQSLLLSDIPRCSLAINQVQILIVCVVMLIVQLTIAIILSPLMALVAATIILLGLGASTLWLPRAGRTGAAISRDQEVSSAAAFRLHSGLKSALAQGTVPEFLAEYRSSLGRLSGEMVTAATHQAQARSFGGIAAAVVAALLLVLGDRVLDLPFAVLLTLLIIFARMSAPAQQLQQSMQLFRTHAPAFEAILQRIGSLRPAPAVGGAAEPLDWREVRLSGVSFRHDAEHGIDRLSLCLSRGEWVALTGRSGSGKTTIADLLCGLIAPERGEVLVDGAELEGAVLERWRRSIAYVAQGDSVFEDTIRANLVVGRDRAVSDDRLWGLLDLVGIGERVRRGGEGMDADVGGRGSALSGGERQRLALARALLRQPSLIVLDEATSALDAESETALLARIARIEPRPALLIITHRPGTAALCDRQLRVDSGSIVEC